MAEAAVVTEGGKAANLRRLVAAGVDVPRFAVVGADVLERFLADSGAAAVVAEATAGLTEERADVAADSIAAAITGAVPAPEVHDAIVSAYGQAGGGPVAVRSSGEGEDGAQYSFAGQYETVLNVTGEDAVVAAVLRCWASAWSARALRYRLLNDLSLYPVKMAVVVQAMVVPDVSGVIFTADPVTGGRAKLVVSATYGLGEAVVSGRVDADTITLDRDSGALRDVVLGAKEERLDATPDGSVEASPVPSAKREARAVANGDLERLREVGLRLEEVFGAPQDVEWAIEDGRLWILQSRPITAVPRAPQPADGELRIWDNSNIIESYGEIVAPLTYTFREAHLPPRLPRVLRAARRSAPPAASDGRLAGEHARDVRRARVLQPAELVPGQPPRAVLRGQPAHPRAVDRR